MTSGAIAYTLTGRLGNQLQLWACARTIALRHDLEFLHRPFTVDVSPLTAPVYERRATRLTVPCAAATRRLTRLHGHDWDETGNERGVIRQDLLGAGGLFVLDWSGIFTRVDEYRSVLVAELVGERPRARVSGEAVAVHVRQGDAAYPQPLEFYVEALAALGVGPGDRVTLFSDGTPAQVAQVLRDATGANVTTPRDTAMADMLHMAAHSRMVLSQSWFSYWAAFLSDAERVVAPGDFCYYPTWQAG